MQAFIIKTKNITNEDEIYNLIKNNLKKIGILVIETFLEKNSSSNIVNFKDNYHNNDLDLYDISGNISLPFNYEAHFIFKLLLKDKVLFIPLVLFSSGKINYYGVKSKRADDNIYYYKDLDIDNFIINLDNHYDDTLYENINDDVEQLMNILL